MYRSSSRQSGLSLVELIIFIVIVSIGLAGILWVMNVTVRHSADPQQRKQALAIAESLMEEVMLARFTYCDPSDPAAETARSAAECTTPEQLGPEGGAGDQARPFDNVNDYVTQWNVPQPAFGVPLTDVAGADISVNGTYSATLTLTPEPLQGIASTVNAGSTAAINALRVTVAVTYGGETITLEGYRTRYAPRSIP